jgi:hypothetical protein
MDPSRREKRRQFRRRDTVGMNLFQRLARARPAPTEERKRPLTEIEQAQRLLDFLQKWGKSTISEREIRVYGPGCLRNRESAIKAAETLVRFGWLIATPTRPNARGRRGHQWEITPKTVAKPVVRPAVAAEQQIAVD